MGGNFCFLRIQQPSRLLRKMDMASKDTTALRKQLGLILFVTGGVFSHKTLALIPQPSAGRVVDVPGEWLIGVTGGFLLFSSVNTTVFKITTFT